MMETGSGLPADMRQIAEGFAVAGQISADQVRAIADSGYVTIICNRPDNEAPGQPGAAEIQAEAKRLGLNYYFIPVVHAGLTAENIAETRKALSAAEGPVFAYCRSGARSTNLFAAAST